jgi:hypothetical protein
MEAEPDAFSKGILAFKRGDSIITNPYEPGSPESAQWRSGWLEALEVKRKSQEDSTQSSGD